MMASEDGELAAEGICPGRFSITIELATEGICPLMLLGGVRLRLQKKKDSFRKVWKRVSKEFFCSLSDMRLKFLATLILVSNMYLMEKFKLHN